MRSRRPFCCGRPGSMSSGRMPRRTHHAESVDKRANVVVEQPREDRLRLGDGRRGQRLAAQEVAAEPIGDCQRVAIPAVTRPELPLVVGTPHVVGGENLGRWPAGMSNLSTLAADGHHPMPAQDVARRGATGEAPSGIALVQQGQELLAAPAWVSVSGLEDRGHDLLGGLIRRAPRSARALLQAGWPVGDASLHGMGTSLVPRQDFACYPCPWTKLLPMCPDRTVSLANNIVERTGPERLAAHDDR